MLAIHLNNPMETYNIRLSEQQCSGFKDTHRGKAPSNKTPALTKSINMGICVVGTTNQLFIRVS